MKKRVISGAVYTAILIAFFLTKIFAPAPWGNLGFDALIYFFSVVGTWEMLRAMKASLTNAERIIVTVFSVIAVPICAIFEAFFGCGIYATAAVFFLLMVALLCLLVLRNEETAVESVGSAISCAVYPTLLLCLLTLTNHLGEDVSNVTSILAMVFIFTVSPLSDVAAFFTGMNLRKKFPKKLAPAISPNKTVVGFVGGILGGGLVGVAIYFIYNASWGSFANMYIELPIYVLIGLVTSLASAFGDLVESAIKRQRGIKDMGNIMPGHGGVLDRIDGTMFATVVIYAAFALMNFFAI
jgi:phosphatidate cytidylyltransferase